MASLVPFVITLALLLFTLSLGLSYLAPGLGIAKRIGAFRLARKTIVLTWRAVAGTLRFTFGRPKRRVRRFGSTTSVGFHR